MNAIAHVESRNRTDVVSARGALGPMQLMPRTAAWCGVDPLVRWQARRCARRLLRLHLRRFGDLEHALAAYVWGGANVASGEPWPASVRRYVERVKARAM